MIVFPVSAPPGGILTRVAGVVTGLVTIGIPLNGKVVVAYRGSDEWYRVAGAVGDLTHGQIVARLTANAGIEPGGNPIPSRLN